MENKPQEHGGKKLLWINEEWSFTVDSFNITLRRYKESEDTPGKMIFTDERYYSNWKEALWALIDRGILSYEFESLKEVINKMEAMRDEVKAFASTLPSKEQMLVSGVV